jgi:hypothetical protein
MKTEINLQGNQWIHLETSKQGKQAITFATVVNVKEDKTFTWDIFGDFNEAVKKIKAPVIGKKEIEYCHALALQEIDTIKSRALSHYSNR